MKKEIPFLLLGIIILSLVLRIYQLGKFPVGFHIDEAQVGYNAYSLLETGKDEFGNFLPHHLKIFDSDRPMGLFYLVIPSIALFGLNEFATRLPTAILGSITIIIFYLLIDLLFANKILAIVGAFLLSISPWHVIFSRSGIENILELFNVLMGAFLLFQGLRKKRKLAFLLAYLFFVYAYFSYMPSRVFTPLLLFGFGVIFYKELLSQKMFKSFIFIFILYLIFPFATFMLRSEATSRFRQIGLFTNPGVQLKIDEQIREAGSLSPLITRAFHNKPINYALAFFENYQEYFTGKFLFTFGGFPMRFRLPQMGVLYFFELPFLFLGFFNFLTKKGKDHRFILYWLITAPIAASLTVEDIPNFQRALLMAPPLVILIAAGIGQTFNFFKKIGFAKLGTIAIGLGYLYGLFFFFLQYFIHQKVHRPWYRMYEMKELVSEVVSRENQYERIIMTKNSTEPYIFFLFYQKVNPADYQKLAGNLDWEGSWTLGKYQFIGEDCPLAIEELEKNAKYLYIEKGECLRYKWKKNIKEIKRPDNSLALRLVEVDLPEYIRWKEARGLEHEN